MIDIHTLEEFHFFLNYKFDSMSPIAVVLVGQTELWDNKMKLQKYTAIRQRINMYCTLPHLGRSETEAYIRNHMSYAGCDQDIFTEKATNYRISSGIPRIINRICEETLI